MGLFGFFKKEDTRYHIKEFENLLTRINSAEGDTKQQLTIEYMKRLNAINDLVFLNRLISRMEHWAFPNQRVLNTFVQRAHDIVSGMNDIASLKDINEKVWADVKVQETKEEDGLCSNCVDRIISDRINQFEFAAKKASIAAMTQKVFDENKGKPQISVSTKNLLEAYSSDETAADEKYKNKPLLLKGKVSSTSQQVDGTVAIDFSEYDYDYDRIECIMSRELPQDAQIYARKIGSDVKIKGICIGLDKKGIVVMENCLLIGSK